MRRLVLFAALAAGCNSFTPEQPDGGGDDIVGDDVPIDAPDGSIDAPDAEPPPVPMARLEIDRTDVQYGDLPAGARSSSATFRIRNVGEATSVALGSTIEGAAAAEFQIVSDSCDGQILIVQDECEILVDFLPTTDGDKAAQLLIDAGDAGQVTASLAGHALVAGDLELDDVTSHDFGAAPVAGQSTTLVLNVQNSGEADTGALAVSISDDAFAIVDDDCTGAPLLSGHSCTLTVRFVPDVIGEHTASVTISASPGGATARSLRGTGTVEVDVDTTGGGAGHITSQPGGLDCGATCTAPFGQSHVVLTAVPDPGATFQGWSGACASASGDTCTLELAANAAVGARFEGPQPLTVAISGNGTVTSNPNGILCGTDCNQTYPYNTTVELTAVGTPGNTFTGWSGACSGTNPVCTVTMSAARNTTATFTLDQEDVVVAKSGNGSGTVTSAPGGISCGGDCSQTWPYGTVVTLTAAVSAGSTFGGWTGACAGQSGTTCTLTLADDASIGATFTLQKLALAVTKAGTGFGSVTGGGLDCGATCSANIDYGTSVTLTAVAADGSDFSGWSAPCGTAAQCTVTMDVARSLTATFTRRSYALSVVRAGTGAGRVTAPNIDCGSDCTDTVLHGTTVTLTAEALTGGTFAGWSGDCSGAQPTCTVTMTQARSVTATFNPVVHTLTVTKNGTGSGTVSATGIDCGTDCTQAFDYNTQVSLTPAAAPGSRFVAWSGDCSGSGGCTVTMTAARNVQATFDIDPNKTLTVIKSGNGAGTVTSNTGGINCGSTCSADYSSGASVVLTAAADTATSTFTGWSGACSGTSTCTVTMDAAKTAVATFTLKTYALTVTATGPVTVTSSPGGINCPTDCTQTYDHGQSVTLTATVATGVTRAWGGACSGSAATCTVSMTQARSVTMTATVNQYALSVAKNGTGSGTVGAPGLIDCGSTCSAQVSHGTQVTLTATAASSSNFAGWSGACTGTAATCTVTMDAAKSVTATFTLKTYALAVTKPGNGPGTVAANVGSLNCGGTCSATYDHGTSVTLTATAGNGATFTGWSGDCSGTAATCTVSMTAAKNVTATFTLNTYALNVTRTGNGNGTVTSNVGTISCGATCSGTYNHGTSVTLTAAATIGTTFTGWGGACSGTASTCTLTMDGIKNVTATFTLDTHVLTVAKSGTGSGTVTAPSNLINCGSDCSEGYPYGTSVVLTAGAANGSTFSGWSGGGCSGSASTCTVTVDAAKTVTAQFTINTYYLTTTIGGSGSGTINGPGINCSGATGSACATPFTYNTSVTLTASGTGGYGFAGWTSGGCSGLGSCTVLMSAAKNVTAKFEPYRTLTLHKGTASSVTVTGAVAATCSSLSCPYSVPDGTTNTVEANLPSTRVFIGWDGTVCLGESSSTCTFTMTGNETVTPLTCLATDTCCINPDDPSCFPDPCVGSACPCIGNACPAPGDGIDQ